MAQSHSALYQFVSRIPRSMQRATTTQIKWELKESKPSELGLSKLCLRALALRSENGFVSTILLLGFVAL